MHACVLMMRLCLVLLSSCLDFLLKGNSTSAGHVNNFLAFLFLTENMIIKLEFELLKCHSCLFRWPRLRSITINQVYKFSYLYILREERDRDYVGIHKRVAHQRKCLVEMLN